MRARAGVLFGCLLVLACGGRNTRRSPDNGEGIGPETAASGAGGSFEGQLGGSAGSSGDTGPPSDTAMGGGSPSNGGEGGAPMGEAGAPPLSPAPDSGVRFCESAPECGGLECRTHGAHPEHVCVTSCPNGNECRSDQLCTSGVDLEPTCLMRCDWPTDCAYRFDCFDWYDDGQYVCTPTAWLHSGS
jgi:hypothetical protein